MIFQKIKRGYERYERRLSSAALIVGFIVDNLTLRRIDLPFENFVLFSYLTLAGLGIFLLNLYDGEVIKSRFLSRFNLPLILVFVIQFSFGALFSAFFVFYSRSASLVSSWPFMLIVVGMLIGNEFFKKHYARLAFQMSIYFLAVFTFMIFFVPVMSRSIGAWEFILSGALSLLIVWGLVYLLSKFIPTRVNRSKNPLMLSILSIYLVINFFYFLNIIPPIPLALKSADIYHSIERVGGDYRVLTESRPWYSFLFLRDQYYISSPSSDAYAFSSVFAPTDLRTNIVHEWQFRNESGDWITKSRIEFHISGGRGDGYRGYSVKNNITPGIWRVNVKTPRGQLIGRKSFEVIRVNSSPSLETQII